MAESTKLCVLRGNVSYVGPRVVCVEFSRGFSGLRVSKCFLRESAFLHK